MADKSYSNLFQKYNNVVARNIDLQEQIKTKEEQWKKLEASFKVAEKNARELCEKILATNPDEMTLGKEKSWSELSFTQIIERTNKAYLKYRNEQLENYKKFQLEQEKRRERIEQLEMELSEALTAGVTTKEALEEQIKKQKEQEEVQKKASKKILDSGTQLGMVKEEDGDFAPEPELDAYDDVAQVNEVVQITPKSIKYSPNKKNLDLKKARKQNAESSVHFKEVEEAREKISDIGWVILETMGDTGHSVYTEIETDILLKDSSISKSLIRKETQMLGFAGIINTGVKVKNPLKKSFSVYEMTKLGLMVYKNKFNRDPKPSEMGIILKEHDNLEHGYGIKFVADELRKNKQFKIVSEMNRTKAIPLPSGGQYIPDIYIEDNNGLQMYFEYECGNTTQTEFNAKCSKMSSVTKTLNFIGPNKDVTESLKAQVQKWITNKGQKVLENITIRIASAAAVASPNADIIQNTAWEYVFKPGKRTEPYINY